jgi:hypothetical protein
MEGFDIRIDGDILEVRTEGVRTSHMGRDPRRAFESFLAATQVNGVLFDIRGAQYDFAGTEWAERARIIARLCRRHAMAVIGREDQDAQIAQVIEHHIAMDGESEAFRSRRRARDWLRSRIDAMTV